jgi:hypothetical protein
MKRGFLRKVLMVLSVVLIAGLFMSVDGCTDADVASANISEAAEQFEIFRRVVFYNGITDEYILMIEGYCSVEFYPDKFTVTVKLGPDNYVKHYLGRADNVFPFVEQLDGANVSTQRYRVVFKPSVIVPNIDIE